MNQINLFLRLNTKTYCGIVPCNTTISSLYEIIESKSNTSVKKTHVLKINGKIAHDDAKLADYNISPDTTIEVQYSLSKADSNRDPDIEGEMMFTKFIKQIAHDSGLNDINIVSLMSYNVDLSNVEKILLQQLQWPTLTKELKRLDKKIEELEGIINVNIIMPDRNFISYNELLNPYVDTSEIFIEKYKGMLTNQIDSLCGIKLNSAFFKNAHEYNYRIGKYSVMLQNFRLKKIFGVSKPLEKIVQLNFYYVGIIFENAIYNNPKKYIAHGFDFSPLSSYNLHVHVWTGDKII